MNQEISSDQAPPTALPVSDHPQPGPVLDFLGLDVLWLQVTGTVCNLACTHCFITCGPKNESHPIMDTAEVLAALERAVQAGVKEVYFTGGEPFLHPDLQLLIERTLEHAPLSILTNGVLIDASTAAWLARCERESAYSLELRVSVDGVTPAENDPIRGRGTYEKIMQGARNLLHAGLNPVFTVTTVHAVYDESSGRTGFLEHLRNEGFHQPRVKFIPPFHIGREERRGGAYPEGHVLTPDALLPGEEWDLQCGSCRTVTAKGVYPCPILIEAERARLGDDLESTFVPIRLNHPACVTCHEEKFSCRT